MLSNLARNLGKVVPNEEMIVEVWGFPSDYSSATLLRNMFNRLRNRLGETGIDPRYVVTVLSVGYMMPDLNSPEEETEREIKLLIGPINNEGREDEIQTHSIRKEVLTKDIILDNKHLHASGEARNLINILHSLPDGMAVLRSSLVSASVLSHSGIQHARKVLMRSESDYTIGTAFAWQKHVRYYLKKVSNLTIDF